MILTNTTPIEAMKQAKETLIELREDKGCSNFYYIDYNIGNGTGYSGFGRAIAYIETECDYNAMDEIKKLVANALERGYDIQISSWC